MAQEEPVDRRTRPGPGIEITPYGGPAEIIDDPGDIVPPPCRFASIDRARFERVRAYVVASEAWENHWATGIEADADDPDLAEERDAIRRRLVAAADAILPGDLDPLP